MGSLSHLAGRYAPRTEFRQIRFSNFENRNSERVRIPTFHLCELDWDGDGYVQRREIPKKISRYVKFDKIDRNQDGEIDALESGGKSIL